MGITETFVLTGLITGALMLVAWTVELVHIRRGNKNRWLTNVIGLLLVSQIFFLIRTYANYSIYIKLENTALNWILLSVGIGGWYLFFNLAHFFLAYRYQAISKRIPA